MTPSRATPLRYLLPLALLMLTFAACGGVQSPNGWAPPVQTDDALYVSLDDGRLSALDDENNVLWEFGAADEYACGNAAAKNYDLEGIYGAPAIGDDLVYVGGYDGSAYAINKADGACAWEFKTDDVIVGGVVLGEFGLYVPSSDGNLYLVDPETGEETDRFAAGDLWATPLLAEDALYQPTMEGKLWKLDLETLEPIWDEPFETSAALLTAPGGLQLTDEVSDGVQGSEVPRLVVGGIGRTLFSIDPETGDEQWAHGGGNWFWGQPAVLGEFVFATNLDGKVYALDSATGDELWSFDTEETIRAAATLLGDGVMDVIVVNNSGDVYSLNAETGDRNWGPTELKETVYADPVVIDGEVFIVARNGSIFAIDEEGRATTVVDG